MKLPSLFFLIGLFASLLPVHAQSDPRPAGRLRVAENLQGAYQTAMQAVAKLPRNPAGIELVPAASAGSKTTLQQIKRGVVDVGLVQANTDFTGSGASAVRSLYKEVFFVVTKTPARSLQELASRSPGRPLRISGLPKGSQTEVDCRRVLSASGIRHYRYVAADHRAAIAQLRSHSTDAAFFVTALGSETLASVRDDRSLHLIPVLVTPWHGVSTAVVPAGAVLHHAPAFRTLYTSALLVVSDNSPQPLVRRLVTALDRNGTAIQRRAPFVTVTRVPAALHAPISPAAK